MKMMTKELEGKIPSLNKLEELDNPLSIIHYFHAFGAGDWYVIAGDKQENGDWLFYGYVKSPLGAMFDEFGTFTLNELTSVKKFGVNAIERDLYWEEVPINEIIK